MELSGTGIMHVWRRNMKVWLRYWLSNLLSNFVEPFVYLLGIGYGLGHFVHGIHGIPYATYIAPGIIASSAMFAASFENTFGTYVRLQFQKTFDAIIATPVGIDEVTAGELLYGATKSTLFAAVILVAVTVTGIVPPPPVAALLVPFVGLLAGLVFGALGMTVAALAPNIDNFNYYITLFLTPMFVVSGIFYPVSSLPPFARVIAWFLPLTHVVSLMRGFVLRGPHPGFNPWGDVFWLVVAICIAAPWPIVFMRRRLIR